LWRRTLVAIPEMNKILAPNLAKRLGVEVAVAQGLMNRLEKEGFIKSSGRNKKYVLIVSLKKI
jgi:ribosomal protein S25